MPRGGWRPRTQSGTDRRAFWGGGRRSPPRQTAEAVGWMSVVAVAGTGPTAAAGCCRGRCRRLGRWRLARRRAAGSGDTSVGGPAEPPQPIRRSLCPSRGAPAAPAPRKARAARVGCVSKRRDGGKHCGWGRRTLFRAPPPRAAPQHQTLQDGEPRGAGARACRNAGPRRGPDRRSSEGHPAAERAAALDCPRRWATRPTRQCPSTGGKGQASQPVAGRLTPAPSTRAWCGGRAHPAQRAFNRVQ